MGRWSQALAGAASEMMAEKRTRDETRRARLERIREQLSLTNAQSAEQTRVIPGGEAPDRGLPANVAGPGQYQPEQVERYKRQYRFNEERGEYEGYDEPISRTENQWTQSDVDIESAGGKTLTKRTESDLTGRKRSSFDIEDAAPKLTKTTVRDGEFIRDVMIDSEGNEVRELGRGRRNMGGGSDSGERNDERVRTRAADKQIADEMGRMERDPEYRAERLAEYASDPTGGSDPAFQPRVPTLSEYENILRRRIYSRMKVGDDQAPAKPKSQAPQTPKAGKQPSWRNQKFAPDVMQMIEQARENGYSDAEIERELRNDGIIK
jgi:hypothetical protein